MPKTIFTGDNLAVVETIRDARVKAGLRQEDLATRVGKDQSWLSLVERSQRRLDVVEFIALARAMKIKPEQLMTEVLKRMDR